MSFQKKPRRVSVILLIDELKELCSAVTQAQVNLSAAIDTRNEAMVELKALGVPERTLVKLSGLSQSSVAKITTGARKHADALLVEARSHF